MNSISYHDGRAYPIAMMDTEYKARGINTHSWFTHFFVDALGSGTVELADGTYLNKASCYKWIYNKQDVDTASEVFRKFQALKNKDIIKLLEGEIKPLYTPPPPPVIPETKPISSSDTPLHTKEEIKSKFEELFRTKNKDEKSDIGNQLQAGYDEDDCPVLMALKEFMTKGTPSNFSIDVAEMTDKDQEHLSKYLTSLLEAKPAVPEPKKPVTRKKIPLPDPTTGLSEQDILAQFKKIYEAKNQEERKGIAEELRLRIIDTDFSLDQCPFTRELFFYFAETHQESFQFNPKSPFIYLDRHILSSFLESF